MPTLVHDGQSLHYEVHGEGQPVILLHGLCVSFAANFAAWGWIQRLADRGLQVIGLDLRGHGGSDKPHDVRAYGTAPMAADVVALMDHLALDSASLVGYSLGSAVALDLLRAQPERCGASALVGAGDGLVGLSPLTLDSGAAQVREALAQPDLPAGLPMHMAAYWTYATKVAGDRLACLAAARASYPPCPPDAAARIQVPVLVVSGARDLVVGRGPQLAKAIPRGRYVEIAAADHFALARDETVQAAVAEFLSSD